MRPSRNTLAKPLAPSFQISLLLPLIQEMPQQTHTHAHAERDCGLQQAASAFQQPLWCSQSLLPHGSSLQALHEGSGVLPRVLKGLRAAALLATEGGGAERGGLHPD